MKSGVYINSLNENNPLIRQLDLSSHSDNLNWKKKTKFDQQTMSAKQQYLTSLNAAQKRFHIFPVTDLS